MAVGTNKPWHHLRILFLECSPTKPLCMGLQIAGRAVGWRGTVLAPPAYPQMPSGPVVLATRIHRTTAPVLARARMPCTFDWPFTYGACFDYAIPPLQGRTCTSALSTAAHGYDQDGYVALSLCAEASDCHAGAPPTDWSWLLAPPLHET